MTPHQNLDTIRSIYDAFGRGDVQTILDALTDDVDWAADSAAELAPWHGQRLGKEAVTGFFAGIAGVMEVTEFTVVGMAASDNEVFAFIRYGFKASETGEEGTMNLHHYWRLRDGKIEYYRGSEDTALTSRVFGAAVPA